MDDLAEIKQRIDKAHTEICELAERGVSRRWRMHIPAQPDRDSDLIISRALADAEKLVEAIERVRVVAEQLKRGSLVEQEIADRLIRTLDPKPDDPAVLADRLAACPLGLRHHGCDCEPLATDGQARTTTDNRGHCQGCDDSLAACREEGGRCCDLCQHPASPKEQ